MHPLAFGTWIHPTGGVSGADFSPGFALSHHCPTPAPPPPPRSALISNNFDQRKQLENSEASLTAYFPSSWVRDLSSALAGLAPCAITAQ